MLGINCKCGCQFDVPAGYSRDYVRCPACGESHYLRYGEFQNLNPATTHKESESTVQLSHSWDSEPVVSDIGLQYGSEHLSLKYDQEKNLYRVRFFTGDANEGRHWMNGQFSRTEKEKSGDLESALEYYLELAERYAPSKMFKEIKKQIKLIRKGKQ